jgi:twitching motility protein PilT
LSFFSKWTKKLSGQPEDLPVEPAARVYEPEIPALEPVRSPTGSVRMGSEDVYVLDMEIAPPPPPMPEPVHEVELVPPDDFTLDDLLHLLVNSGGSDLHLAVHSPPIERVHGDLVRMKAPVLTQKKLEQILYPIMGYEQKEKYFASGNLDFAYEIKGLARFRANYFNQYHGMAAVFRIIPSKIPTIDKLNLPPVLKKIAMYRSGMVIVTGPTGSGKSTTLAAMIDYINDNRPAHIITIEDPLEFSHINKQCVIDHREVGIHATEFADALRSSLREDPDIILVGEMRDLETIYQAVKAAETGVLVFATLHTNSAPKTVDRMIDVFPAKQQEQIRSMLSESLRAVVAQQLMKTKDGKGRCAANEILISMSGLGNLIREGKTNMIPSFIQTGREHGMTSMDLALIELLKQGKIDLKAAKEKASDPNIYRMNGYDLDRA